MSDGIGELLRRYLAAGDAGRYAELTDVLHADVVVHTAGGATLVGIDAQVDAWRAAHEGLGGLEHRIEDLLVAADRVAARVRVRGRHEGAFLGVAPTGAELEVDQAVFARARDGRLIEVWEVVDTGHGLAQLGALPTEQSLAPGRTHRSSTAPPDEAG